MASSEPSMLQDDTFVLTRASPGPAQKRLAVAVAFALFVMFLITVGPLSAIRPGPIAAFVPAYTMAMFLSEMITAVLLFSQFSILRTRALLVISTGYFFTALITIPWVLTFPGIFGTDGLIGGLQTRPYTYFFWHAGFPAFVIVYTLLKDQAPSKNFWNGSASSAIALSTIATTLIVVATIIFFALESAILPGVQVDLVHVGPLFVYLGAPTALLIIVALLALWIRRRTILDLWLMVVMCAYEIEIILDYYPFPGIYSFGWYASRVFGLLSSSIVLLVLLYEIMTLYSRLLDAVRAQRHEREARLMTGDAVAAAIAHEVKQPLSAMITRAETCFRRLDRSEPQLDKAKEEVRQIAADGHRAGAIIDSIRANFKKDPRARSSVDVNELIEETFALMRGDLQKQRIEVQTTPNAALPPVAGDRIQLQQVILNLITNAIDSMAAENGPRVISVRSEFHDDRGILISVADTGPGIDPQNMERVFNPLFTTKSGGMGMGLSICRSIIEAHDGRLWVAPNAPKGAVFRFALRPAE
jgi:signal transduction histidine kinase